MASYCMFLTVNHRLDCTKAKVQVTRMGETVPVYTVEEPEFTSPRSCFNELLHAVEQHLDVVKEGRPALEIVNADE